MNNKNIPCKDCLVYPSCRYREEIYCDRLFYWLEEHPNTNGVLDRMFETWETISTDLGRSDPMAYFFRPMSIVTMTVIKERSETFKKLKGKGTCYGGKDDSYGKYLKQ